MLSKNGSYFADWRDATGKRHRKAFPTLQQAIDFTEQMRAASHPPRPPLPSQRPLRKLRRSGRVRKPTTPTPKPRSRRS